MDKGKKTVYESVALTFTLHTGSVTGVLSGNDHQWSFDSDSPPFLKLIPSGRLIKSSFNFTGLPHEIVELLHCIYRTTEDLGYAMEPMK